VIILFKRNILNTADSMYALRGAEGSAYNRLKTSIHCDIIHAVHNIDKQPYFAN
jgi:hypothetical protein